MANKKSWEMKLSFLNSSNGRWVGRPSIKKGFQSYVPPLSRKQNKPMRLSWKKRLAASSKEFPKDAVVTNNGRFSMSLYGFEFLLLRLFMMLVIDF